MGDGRRRRCGLIDRLRSRRRRRPRRIDSRLLASLGARRNRASQAARTFQLRLDGRRPLLQAPPAAATSWTGLREEDQADRGEAQRLRDGWRRQAQRREQNQRANGAGVYRTRRHQRKSSPASGRSDVREKLGAWRNEMRFAEQPDCLYRLPLLDEARRQKLQGSCIDQLVDPVRTSPRRSSDFAEAEYVQRERAHLRMTLMGQNACRGIQLMERRIRLFSGLFSIDSLSALLRGVLAV